MNRPYALILTVFLFGLGAAHAQARSTFDDGRIPNLTAHGVTVLPNGWRITPAGEDVPLSGDMPLQVIPDPTGKFLFVNTAGFHDENIDVVRIAWARMVQNVDVRKDWAGLAFDPSGGTLYASGGGWPSQYFLNGKGASATAVAKASFLEPILALTWDGVGLTQVPALPIEGVSRENRFIAGLAVANNSLYAVNTDDNAVYRLDLKTHDTVASAQVGYRPYGIAVSADGKAVAVSNWGDRSVSFLDPATLAERARIPVGSHPNQLAFARDGRLFVVNSGSSSVSVLQGRTLIETIRTSLRPNEPEVGSTPDALALSADGTRLYVANADNNDVAVADISQPGNSRILGFIPTAWYPSALALSADGRTLYVGTARGQALRPNVPPTSFYQIAQAPQAVKFDYVGAILHGDISIVPVPTAAALRAYTKQVYDNTPDARSAFRDTVTARAIERTAFTHIKHVLYIIRENRTYDQVFGDLKVGNGDAGLTLFGEQVTPNAHRLAREYALLDNLYTNGDVSEDGHQWCDSAYATDAVEKGWVTSYADRGEPKRDERLVSSPAGYLWDNAARHGLSYRNYGETPIFISDPNAPPRYGATLTGHVSERWATSAKSGARDPQLADVFIDELHTAQRTGVWPNLMVMALPEDHTEGALAGHFTPVAHVAANDVAIGKIVDAVSRSRFWNQTAILMIEDDAQAGPDHVDAHRTVGLVISPYVKRGVVDSTLYTTSSMVRTIELMLHLPPMTQFDSAATPLYRSFGTSVAHAPYTRLAARVDINARNPARTADARASAKLDFSAPDRADPQALNAILWHVIKGRAPLPVAVTVAHTEP